MTAKEELNNLLVKLDQTQLNAVLILVFCLKEGWPELEAAEMAALYLDGCPGYEHQAEIIRSHAKEAIA